MRRWDFVRKIKESQRCKIERKTDRSTEERNINNSCQMMGVSYRWENGNNNREQEEGEEGEKEKELGDGIVITPHIASNPLTCKRNRKNLLPFYPKG